MSTSGTALATHSFVRLLAFWWFLLPTEPRLRALWTLPFCTGAGRRVSQPRENGKVSIFVAGYLIGSRVDEGISGHIADRVGENGFEGRPHNAADDRYGLSEVYRSLFAELGQQAESNSPIDGD